MNRHAALIKRLGGYGHLADILGVELQAVKKWPIRGIPSRHWHKIVALAPDITAEWLARTKPVGVQSRRRGRNGR